MSGWIKIHRKFLNWEWFNKSEAVHLFIYLILKANHKDGQWQGIDVYKGQFITSYGKISVDTGISLQTIRTLLKKFEKTNEINIQTTNKYSVITICKYEDYQTEIDATNNQLTINQQTTNKQLTTNKNNKNEKEESNKAKLHKQPTINEVKDYFKLHGYLESVAVRAFNYYDVADWKDSKGNKVKNWKQKMQSVWFKDENKIIIVDSKPEPIPHWNRDIGVDGFTIKTENNDN